MDFYLLKKLKGAVDSDYWSGNANTATFHKDVTVIECQFEECNDNPCTLPTTMLREIVEIWIKECEKFSKTKKR